MTGRGRIALVVLALLAGSAVAQAPDTSLRPQARPGTPAETSAQPAQPAQPATGQTRATRADPGQATPETRRGGLLKSLRPLLRPREVRRQARLNKRMAEKGAVCGDLAIQGIAIGNVPGKISGCGVQGAVKIRSVAGISLSQQAVMDCQTARTLKSWVEKGLKPNVGNRGGGVARLRVVAHYACRTRNNRKGARISEHGKGRAIDIAGFQLHDGSELTVLTDWGRGREGRILKKLHRSACGPFGTVLGPDADRHHKDHFHFDTARHRAGAYCR